jgi:hypothetical protein
MAYITVEPGNNRPARDEQQKHICLFKTPPSPVKITAAILGRKPL